MVLTSVTSADIAQKIAKEPVLVKEHIETRIIAPLKKGKKLEGAISEVIAIFPKREH